MTTGKTKDGFNIKVSATDGFVPEDAYLEAIMAFMKITGILFQYLQGWVETKENSTPKNR